MGFMVSIAWNSPTLPWDRSLGQEDDECIIQGNSVCRKHPGCKSVLINRRQFHIIKMENEPSRSKTHDHYLGASLHCQLSIRALHLIDQMQPTQSLSIIQIAQALIKYRNKLFGFRNSYTFSSHKSSWLDFLFLNSEFWWLLSSFRPRLHDTVFIS